MIIECPSCSARFHLADGRVPARGARVRCSRCEQRFFVSASGEIEEPPTATPSPTRTPTAAPRAAAPERGADPALPTPRAADPATVTGGLRSAVRGRGPLAQELTSGDLEHHEPRGPAPRKLLSEGPELTTRPVRSSKPPAAAPPQRPPEPTPPAEPPRAPAPEGAKPAPSERGKSAPAERIKPAQRRPGREDPDLENPEFLFDEQADALPTPVTVVAPARRERPAVPAARDAPTTVARPPAPPPEPPAAPRPVSEPPPEPERHDPELDPFGAAPERASAAVTPAAVWGEPEPELGLASEQGGMAALLRPRAAAGARTATAARSSENLALPPAAAERRAAASAALLPAAAQTGSGEGLELRARFERWSRVAAAALALCLALAAAAELVRGDAQLRSGPAQVRSGAWEIYEVEALPLRASGGQPVLAVRGRLRSSPPAAEAPLVRATLLGGAGDELAAPVEAQYPWLEFGALSPERLTGYLGLPSAAAPAAPASDGAAEPGAASTDGTRPAVFGAVLSREGALPDGFTVLIPGPLDAVRRFRLEVVPRGALAPQEVAPPAAVQPAAPPSAAQPALERISRAPAGSDPRSTSTKG